MVVIPILLLAGVAVIVTAPMLLSSGSWRIRHPRVAIRAWLVALASGGAAFASSLAVAVVIVVGHLEQPGDGAFGLTFAALFTWTGLAGAGSIAALLLIRAEPVAKSRHDGELAVAFLAARSAERIQLLGDDEVITVRSEHPIACSTADGRIVVSTAVVDVLSPLALRALLEHERAHVHRRHDLVSRVAAVNEAAFPFLRGARDFRATVSLLVELIADDDAARLCGPAAVCNALTGMAALAPQLGLELRAERLARVRIRRRTRLERLEPVSDR